MYPQRRRQLVFQAPTSYAHSQSSYSSYPSSQHTHSNYLSSRQSRSTYPTSYSSYRSSLHGTLLERECPDPRAHYLYTPQYEHQYQYPMGHPGNLETHPAPAAPAGPPRTRITLTQILKTIYQGTKSFWNQLSLTVKIIIISVNLLMLYGFYIFFGELSLILAMLILFLLAQIFVVFTPLRFFFPSLDFFPPSSSSSSSASNAAATPPGSKSGQTAIKYTSTSDLEYAKLVAEVDAKAKFIEKVDWDEVNAKGIDMSEIWAAQAAAGVAAAAKAAEAFVQVSSSSSGSGSGAIAGVGVGVADHYNDRINVWLYATIVLAVLTVASVRKLIIYWLSWPLHLRGTSEPDYPEESRPPRLTGVGVNDISPYWRTRMFLGTLRPWITLIRRGVWVSTLVCGLDVFSLGTLMGFLTSVSVKGGISKTIPALVEGYFILAGLVLLVNQWWVIKAVLMDLGRKGGEVTGRLVKGWGFWLGLLVFSVEWILFCLLVGFCLVVRYTDWLEASLWESVMTRWLVMASGTLMVVADWLFDWAGVSVRHVVATAGLGRTC